MQTYHFYFHCMECLVSWFKRNGFQTIKYKEKCQKISSQLTIMLLKYKGNMKYVGNFLNAQKKRKKNVNFYFDIFNTPPTKIQEKIEFRRGSYKVMFMVFYNPKLKKYGYNKFYFGSQLIVLFQKNKNF